ncbi:MAG: integrase core domain-containing protein [Actinomycetota bacterium]
MGLTAGPVGVRVNADVKAGLLGLIDQATGGGWSVRRACGVLALNEDRAARWRRRRQGGEPLDDSRPGCDEGLHALLGWERQAIVDVFDEWGQVDRSHRKLAHRGSRLGRVFVSESTVLRVLSAEDLTLPARLPREPVGPRRPWPAWVEYRPCQVWGHDFTAFTRAVRDALGILDLVSRKWITTLVVPHSRGESEHVQAAYTRALEAEGLLGVVEARMVAPNSDQQLPVLLAVSDGGPQMTSGTTREFMALHALAMHVGRPGTPTDQAHIESLWGHVKGEWPHLEQIRDPTMLQAELERSRVEYNTVRLHAGIGYATPDDEHEGRGEPIRKLRREGLRAARAARIAYRRRRPQDRT